jgi:hypothetical protein
MYNVKLYCAPEGVPHTALNQHMVSISNMETDIFFDRNVFDKQVRIQVQYQIFLYICCGVWSSMSGLGGRGGGAYCVDSTAALPPPPLFRPQ